MDTTTTSLDLTDERAAPDSRYFEHFPPEILLIVLAYLPFRDCLRWAQINKHAAKVAQDPNTFRKVTCNIRTGNQRDVALRKRVGHFIVSNVGDSFAQQFVTALGNHVLQNPHQQECSRAYPLYGLALAGNDLRRLPAGLDWGSLEHLQLLDISENLLTAVPAVLPPRLVTVDLSYNRIEELPSGAESALYGLAPTLKFL